MANCCSNNTLEFSSVPVASHNDDIFLLDKKWKNIINCILKELENENVSKLFKIIQFSYDLLNFWCRNIEQEQINIENNATEQDEQVVSPNRIIIKNSKIIFRSQNVYYVFLEKLFENSYFFLTNQNENKITIFSKYEKKEKKTILKLLCNILKNINSFPEIEYFHKNITKFDEILENNQIQIPKISKKLKKKEIKPTVERIVNESIKEKNYELLHSFFSLFCFKKGTFREEFISEMDKQRILTNLDDLPFFNDFFSQVFFIKENFQISTDFLANLLSNLNSHALKIHSKLQKINKIEFSNFVFNFVRFFYDLDKESDFLNFIEREATDNPLAHSLFNLYSSFKEYYRLFNFYFIFNRKYFIFSKKYDFLFRKIDKKLKKIDIEGEKEESQHKAKKLVKIENYLKIKQKIKKYKTQIFDTEKADNIKNEEKELHSEKYKKKGNDYFQAKNYEKAIKNYEKSVKIEKNQVGYLNLCLSFLKIHQNNNSIASGKHFLKNVKKLRKNYKKKEIKLFLLKIYFRIASAYFFENNFEKSFFYSYFCFYFLENKENQRSSLRNSEFFTILKKNTKQIPEKYFLNFSREFYSEKFITPAPCSSISPTPSIFSVSDYFPDFLSSLFPASRAQATGKNQTNFIFHQKNSNQTIYLILENFYKLKYLKQMEENQINFYLLENSILQGARDFFLFSFIQKYLLFCKNSEKYSKTLLSYLFCDYLSGKEFYYFLEHANFLSANFKIFFENSEDCQFFKFQFPTEERKKWIYFNFKQIFQMYSNYEIFNSPEILEGGAFIKNPFTFNLFADSLESSPEILFEKSSDIPKDLINRWNSLFLGFSFLSNISENQLLDCFDVNQSPTNPAGSFVKNSLRGPAPSLIFHFPSFYSTEDFNFYRKLLPPGLSFDFIHFDFLDFDFILFCSFFSGILSSTGFLFTSFPVDFIVRGGTMNDPQSASRIKFAKLFKKYVKIPLKYFTKLFSIFPYYLPSTEECTNLVIWSPSLLPVDSNMVPLFDAELPSDTEFKDFLLEEYWEIIAQHRDLTDPPSLFESFLPVSLNSSTFLFSLLSLSYSRSFNSCFFALFDDILKCISDFDDPNALCICSIYHTLLMNSPFLSNQLQQLNDIYLLQLFNDYVLYHAFITWNSDVSQNDFRHLILVASILERQNITELRGSELCDYLSEVSGRDLQIIDYLSFQPAMNLISFYFPTLFMESDDPTEAPAFYLVDKETFSLVAQPLRVFPFTNKKN